MIEGRPRAAERGPPGEAPHPACVVCVSVAADDDERVRVPGRILKDEVGSVYFPLVYCAPGYLWGRKKLSAECCTTCCAAPVGGLGPRSRGFGQGECIVPDYSHPLYRNRSIHRPAVYYNRAVCAWPYGGRSFLSRNCGYALCSREWPTRSVNADGNRIET